VTPVALDTIIVLTYLLTCYCTWSLGVVKLHLMTHPEGNDRLQGSHKPQSVQPHIWVISRICPQSFARCRHEVASYSCRCLTGLVVQAGQLG